VQCTGHIEIRRRGLEEREMHMACETRSRTGTCGHAQCPFPEHSGYNCIEIVDGFCEAGQGCHDKCEHSWAEGDSLSATAAFEAFKRAFPVKGDER